MLNLNCNIIRNEGATAIAQALQTNRTLRRLFVGGNNIGSEGAAAIAKALVQTKNHSLQELYLDGNNDEIGDDIFDAMHEALVETNRTSLEELP